MAYASGIKDLNEILAGLSKLIEMFHGRSGRVAFIQHLGCMMDLWGTSQNRGTIQTGRVPFGPTNVFCGEFGALLTRARQIYQSTEHSGSAAQREVSAHRDIFIELRFSFNPDNPVFIERCMIPDQERCMISDLERCMIPDLERCMIPDL